MAFGKNKTNPNLKLFTFKIRSKNSNKEEVPVYFEVSEKTSEGKYEVLAEPAYFIEGTLTGLEHDEHMWKGPKGDVLLQNAKAYLKSGDNLYILTIPYNILGRSIINSLVNLTTFDDIEISVYMSKGAKSYPAAIVRQGNKRVDWKHGLDAIPKATKIVTSKGTISDFGPVDAFFINEVKTFGVKVNGSRAAAPDVAPVSPTVDGETVPF